MKMRTSSSRATAGSSAYARPKDGDEVLGVVPCSDRDVIVCATRDGHVLHVKADDIPKLEGPGRGITVIKTIDDDIVIGFLAGGKGDVLLVETEKGGKQF